MVAAPLFWRWVLSLLLLPALAEAGGGWTRKKKRGYAKVGLTLVGSSRYHTLGGQLIETARYRQQLLSLYGEYGLTDRLETVVNLPLYRRATFPETTPGQGIGDAEVGLRYGLLRGRWPLAVGVAVELPTGNPRTRGYSRQDPRSFVQLPTGDGELNIWTRAALSHSLGPAFLTLEAAYNQRTRGFTSQYSYGVQVGYRLGQRLWLTASGRTLANVRPPRPDRLASIGLGEGVAYSTAAVGASYHLGPHLRVGTDWAVGFGRLRNVYSARPLTLGAAWEW
ncbi:hypothetical protein [Hymenobacter rigui]|uniref:Uncharacterized protein n=1 Tax=Hymenobacter rigui TaxID=334424 RepID=A0A3R9P6M5_9BACT|nr:hypothetical protein [Hymenobacter rigui]RSK49907.1 hypothetical protein EI291_04475 [Hymenobacter rigui]